MVNFRCTPLATKTLMMMAVIKASTCDKQDGIGEQDPPTSSQQHYGDIQTYCFQYSQAMILPPYHHHLMTACIYSDEEEDYTILALIHHNFMIVT